MNGSDGNIHVGVGLPHSAGLTGAPRRALDLCTVLRSRGIWVTVIALAQSSASREAEKRGLDVLYVQGADGLLSGGGRLLNPLKALAMLGTVLRLNLRLRRELQRLDADILWVRGARGIGLYALAARLANVPVVWDITYEQGSGPVIRILQRLGLAISSLVVAQYKAAPERIFGSRLARLYAAKIAALTPGINLDRLKSYRARRASRQQSPSTFTILHVGTITPRKGQLLSLEVVDILQKRMPNLDLRVLFVGGTHDPAYEKKLRQFCDHAELGGMVNFLGWQDDVPALMVDADMLMLPSVDEGVPNAVQEAMYLGLPVVASSAGGIPDILSHNETGWLIGETDPKVWAGQIEQVIEEPERGARALRRAQEYAEAHFDVEVWGQQYALLIQRALTATARA